MQEGANAKRCNGYQVYHMLDVMSKNVLNYAMRYENLVNYNYSSQMFICSFIITHQFTTFINEILVAQSVVLKHS